MFRNKYFVLLFTALYDLIKSDEGNPTIMQFKEENEKFDLPFGNETNFLIKATLNYKAFEGSSGDIYMEESIYSDERNRIVTYITPQYDGNPTIEIFRELSTQRILMICFPLESCIQNEDLWYYFFQRRGQRSEKAKKIDLIFMGPYRMISYFANETFANNKISRWVDMGHGRYYMTAEFSDSGSRKLLGSKNCLKITVTEGLYQKATLFIEQVEPLKKISISKANKRVHYELTESIGSKSNSFTIKSLGSVSSVKTSDGKLNNRELVYDYKLGMKYTLSGSNECAIELGDAPDELILTNLEYYGSDAYFPENLVESYSNKFMVKAEYNKVIDNVNYDLVVTTFSRPSPNKSILNPDEWFKGLSIVQRLYSKALLTNEKLQYYNYTESRVIFFSDSFGLDGEFKEIINLHDRCFKDGKDEIILNLKISLLDQPPSRKLHKPLSIMQGIKDEFQRVLMEKLRISFLRLNWTAFNFLNSHIMAKVTIFDSIVNKFKASQKFNIKSTGSGQIYTSTIDDCLRFQINNFNISYVITCKTEHYLCLGIADGDSLPDEDENGLSCMLFNNSDHSLTKLLADVSLEEIRKSYFNLNGSQFNYSDIEFTVVDVIINETYYHNTITDDIHFVSLEKRKLNLIFTLFFIFSILISITIFIKFALYFKLSRRRTDPLHDWVSLKLFKSSI